MSSRRTPDFGRLAAAYDRVRPADANWREVFDVVVREAELRDRSVLDCGCGTGRLARALAEGVAARVVGVDAEPAMVAEARASLPEDIELLEARAEALPFADDAFERAVLWLVSHLLDRPAAFGELRRVLAEDGRLAIVTFDPEHFSDFWLTRYFPSIEEVDRARFPTRAQLERELAEAGFPDARFRRVSQRASLTREEAIERIEARHISTFDLLDEDEVRSGTDRAAAELPPVIQYAVEWLLAFAQR